MKSFPTKDPRVELSGRRPIQSYGHDSSHPLELSLFESNPLKPELSVGGLGVLWDSRRVKPLVLLSISCSGVKSLNALGILKQQRLERSRRGGSERVRRLAARGYAGVGTPSSHHEMVPHKTFSKVWAAQKPS